MGITSHRSPFRLLAALAAAGAVAGAQAFELPLIEARRSAASTRVTVEGHVEPVRQATLAAQLGGNVLQLAVQAGERVRAGQLIARIDERDATAGLQRGDAALVQAEAEARNARLAAERTRELRGQGYVSQAALDNTETQLQAALAGVRQAQALRAQALLARGHATLVAPFDGVVRATHLDRGDLASPGRPIATLYVPGQLRAVVQVGLSQADAARAASRVELELPNGQRVQATQRTELAAADAVSQTVEWRLELPAAAQANLRPGQVVRVHFEAPSSAAPSARGAIRVPRAAVLRRGELDAVYVAHDGGFVLRAVRLGAPCGADEIELVAGLREGERIAADAIRAGLAAARPAR